MVQRIVESLKDFDNVYYEICNEPYFGGVTIEWQGHIAQTIVRSREAGFQNKHLIAQNIANKSKKIEKPNPNRLHLQFSLRQAARSTVAENSGLNKVHRR